MDLELTTPSLRSAAEEVRRRGAKLIISFHDLRGMPSIRDLETVLRKALRFGPDVCKIVGTARSRRDNLTYLSFLADHADTDLVCFAMGRHGVVSRVLSPLFGGAFTYASAARGMETAPGQLTIGALREVYRMLGV